MANAWVLSLIVVINVLFSLKLAAILKIWYNRRGAANNLYSPCIAPIYWCSWPVSTNILVLLAQMHNRLVLRCQSHQYIGAIVPAAPIHWCKQMVKIEIIVSTGEYNGAAVFAAPKTALHICLPRGDVYSFCTFFLIYKRSVRSTSRHRKTEKERDNGKIF